MLGREGKNFEFYLRGHSKNLLTKANNSKNNNQAASPTEKPRTKFFRTHEFKLSSNRKFVIWMQESGDFCQWFKMVNSWSPYTAYCFFWFSNLNLNHLHSQNLSVANETIVFFSSKLTTRAKSSKITIWILLSKTKKKFKKKQWSQPAWRLSQICSWPTMNFWKNKVMSLIRSSSTETEIKKWKSQNSVSSRRWNVLYVDISSSWLVRPVHVFVCSVPFK